MGRIVLFINGYIPRFAIFNYLPHNLILLLWFYYRFGVSWIGSCYMSIPLSEPSTSSPVRHKLCISDPLTSQASEWSLLHRTGLTALLLLRFGLQMQTAWWYLNSNYSIFLFLSSAPIQSQKPIIRMPKKHFRIK